MSPITIFAISIGSAFVVLCIAYFIAGYFAFRGLVYRSPRKGSPKATNNKAALQPKRIKKTIKESFVRSVMGPNYDSWIADVNKTEIALCAREYEMQTVTTDDGLKLVARYFTAEKPSDNTVIFIHGYRASSNGYKDFAELYSYYEKNNFNILLLSLRGHGDSEGKYVGFGILDRNDILKWIYALRAKNPNVNIYLHGLSMGGTAVMMCSSLNLPENVKGIVEDSGFTRPWDIFSEQCKRFMRIPTFPLLNIAEMWTKALAKYDFKSVSAADSVKQSKVPILFIHGGDDKFVPSYMSKVCYDACTAPKELLIIEGAGHVMSYFTDPVRYEAALNKFYNIDEGETLNETQGQV